MTLTLTSQAFRQSGEIPVQNICEGADGRDDGAYGGGNLGYKQRYKEGYFPVPPHDMLQEIRSEIALTLQQAGVQIEVHHHEVASAGQNEIDMRFATLTRMADNVMIYKYICKNVARRHGKVATFMPKPLFADNANGMHCHQSLWKDELNPHHGAHLLRCFDSTTYRNARARDRSAHARRSARGPLR